jgi:hypothetical protein
MPSAFRQKLERDRVREGLSVVQLSRLLGVSVREYRSSSRARRGRATTSERIAEFSGWPEMFTVTLPKPAGLLVELTFRQRR